MSKIKKFFTSRGTKRGFVSVLMTLLFIAAVVVLNVISNLLVDKFPALSADLTSNQLFEMQQDTIDYIKDIDSEVTIYVLATESNFVSNGDYFLQANNLLKQFSTNNEKIKLKYIDLVSNPTFTSKYTDVDWTTSDNMVLVESGDNYRVIPSSELFTLGVDYSSYSQYIESSNVEQSVTTAILNVTNKEKVKYALITSMGDEDPSSLTKLLDDNAYEQVETTLTTMDIDPECSFAVLFAPQIDLDAEGVEKLTKFLDNDGKYGKTLIYIPYYDKLETPNINKLLKDWSLELSDGIVFETDANRIVQSGNPYIYFADYGGAFTEGLKTSNVPVVTPYAREVKILDTEVATAMLTTSDKSGIVPFDADENFSYDSAVTGQPITIAAAAAKSLEDGTTSNLIVLGSQDMFSSNILSLSSFNNSAYVINICNTVSDRDDIGITIEGKARENPELSLTEAQSSFIGLVFRFILPIGILLIGLVLWLIRRNK